MDFDLVPNKPPPSVTQYDEEIEEVEESESDEEDMVDAMVPHVAQNSTVTNANSMRTLATPDAEMASPAPVTASHLPADEGSDAGQDDDDGLCGNYDSDADEAAETNEPAESSNANGIKRKLVEEDDYD